jgi:hypothetical protein
MTSMPSRRLRFAIAIGALLALPATVSASTQATPERPSARVASATNAETTCPLWSELTTEGKLAGRSPQVIAISKKMMGSAASGTEWEVVGPFHSVRDSALLRGGGGDG